MNHAQTGSWLRFGSAFFWLAKSISPHILTTTPPCLMATIEGGKNLPVNYEILIYLGERSFPCHPGSARVCGAARDCVTFSALISCPTDSHDGHTGAAP